MAGSPASPRVGNVNGADVELTGKLLRVNAGWVCIGVDKAEYTIPKEAILLIEMKPKVAATNSPSEPTPAAASASQGSAGTL
jgi:hypothetical protein